MKLSKADIFGVVLLVVFVIIIAIPTFISKEGCEVARPGYKCESAKNVIIENCEYWSQFNCEHCEADKWKECIDPSIPNVQWYTENLCEIHNQFNEDKFDCSNLRLVCNQAVGEDIC